ncbi:MAG: hypothetical protein CO012_03770 [Syntrophobacterales bacterium CG_4_8_14_3_um_filter_49_14]|nr:MAG: hypothetical protein COX52_04115 [Syntrophobacterales bacterium CG23_combo_of_CG06-09_8_20_14_all_48_27]PJC75275.1 MAG: hypothetical protein CO012_03770 [Syntrophobacterales bacterium CG_4_8_14_3_um_filter_49_14]
MSKKHQATRPHSQSLPSAAVKGMTTHLQINTNTLVGLLDLGPARSLIDSIEQKRQGSRLLCIVYNDRGPLPAMLTPSALNPLAAILSRTGKMSSLDVFLRSTGGITEVPWRIVTLLREFSDRLSIIVPSIALSGATHLAIAGDELIMTPFSVLGSVDPTRNHSLLPKDAIGKPIPTSVEDLKHCIKFIREQLEESYQEQDLALIISELFKYINPLAIGALEQSYNLSKLITRKCLTTRKEPLTEEKINKIVDQLAGGYFSHSFLISRAEVEKDLGLPVTRPDAELTELISRLENHYVERFGKEPQPLPAPNSQLLVRLGGVIQVADNGWAIAQIIKQDGQPVVDPWIPFS